MPRPTLTEQIATLDVAALKRQALELLKRARADAAAEYRVTVQQDDRPRVEFVIERTWTTVDRDDSDGGPPGPEDELAEQVTVKAGPKTGPRTLFTGPASWLES